MKHTDLPFIVRDERRTHYFTIDNIILDQYGKRLGAHGLAVYMALCRFANRQSECWPSYQTIAERTGMSRRQVIREIQQIKTLGLIAVLPQYDEKTGEQRTNLYVLLEVQTQRPGEDHQGTFPDDHQSPAGDRVPLPPGDTESRGPAHNSSGGDSQSRRDDHVSPLPVPVRHGGNDTRSPQQNLNNNTYEEEPINNNGGEVHFIPGYVVEEFAFIMGADPTEKECERLKELAGYPDCIIREALGALEDWLMDPNKETIRNPAAWIVGTARRKQADQEKEIRHCQQAARIRSRHQYKIPAQYRDIIIA